MLRVFLKKHDFDPDMLIRVMLIKQKRVITWEYNGSCKTLTKTMRQSTITNFYQ